MIKPEVGSPVGQTVVGEEVAHREATPLPARVAIGLATLGLAFWVLFVRSANDAHLPTWEPFAGLGFDPYLFGLAAREVAVPLVLLLLFSRSDLFRRLVQHSNDISEREAISTGYDSYRLTAIMAGILLISLLSQFGLLSLINDRATMGFFLVFIAGWLGGWQVGLATGAVAAVGIGLLEYVGWDWPDGFQLDGWLSWAVLYNMEAMGALWVGFVAGQARKLVDPRRCFDFGLLVGTMALCEIVIALAVYLSNDWSIYYLARLVPMIATSSLAVVALALMARSVQSEAERHQIEVTRIQLAETELTLTQTRLALAQAELRALHAQINPHFFFNSLNTIRYFIRTDPLIARDLLTNLSDLFQRVLSAGEFVTLSEEISHVEAYLALESARLDERLTVIWTHLAKEQSELSVPTLILQPLVENAVIHGIGPKEAGGTVHIVLNRVHNDLLIQVSDDGIGFEAATALATRPLSQSQLTHLPEERGAIGLRNIDNRLRRLYGDDYGLVIDSQPDAGTRVVIHIPLKAATI